VPRSTPVPAALIAIRVQPGASRPRVGGGHPGRYGPALVVRVGAPAVDGRATAAAIEAVAAALGLRRADVTLHQGATSRDKVLAVAYPPNDLESRLAALRDAE
jgi:uncharacterized protein YggU (UPF0235/DUF167 family)